MRQKISRLETSNKIFIHEIIEVFDQHSTVAKSKGPIQTFFFVISSCEINLKVYNTQSAAKGSLQKVNPKKTHGIFHMLVDSPPSNIWKILSLFLIC